LNEERRECRVGEKESCPKKVPKGPKDRLTKTRWRILMKGKELRKV